MDELISLYRERLKIVDGHLKEYNLNVPPEKKATNPFFITIPDDYGSYSNRIMIFGQETNGWCNECGNNSEYSNSLDKSIEIYRKFYLNGGINSYSGPFWNEFKRIRKAIQEHKNTVFLWNNVNKIGRIGKGNIKEINEIQFRYFQLIRDEIELLKPNVIVFLTGSDYDYFIENNFGKFKQTEISDSIWEISFNDDRLKSIKSFKTYHPNALYFKGKNRTVIPNLINEIKNACI
ncbi:Uracil DNA glycosylase superfamily protein [Daejeonella rubra]|uniref:Uracil DNA glycosylase superfamily protein n=1 Tax=Daejeonella rubra TaxID=990371 RepID=A0A1G9T0K0_9SPHI|nr:hypothetical protein [Daejeonella rubra]SDM41166.1 Uracil DNA glycosylase superfamily protein [Daejeonella rubra]